MIYNFSKERSDEEHDLGYVKKVFSTSSHSQFAIKYSKIIPRFFTYLKQVIIEKLGLKN